LANVATLIPDTETARLAALIPPRLQAVPRLGWQ
jgi:hypothetical protein